MPEPNVSMVKVKSGMEEKTKVRFQKAPEDVSLKRQSSMQDRLSLKFQLQLGKSNSNPEVLSRHDALRKTI